MALAGKNQVVTRYKFSIIGVFVAIMLVAFMLASFRYYNELRVVEKNELNNLINQASLINRQFNQAANSVAAIRNYADHTLNFPEEVPLKLPRFSQEGERFYLQKPRHDIIKYRQQLSVNITGVGDINDVSEPLINELAMAHSLTPAFMTAQNANETANWFYYVSQNQFVSIYPWVSRKNWQYSDNLIQNEHIKRLSQSSFHSQAWLWSEPYIGTSSKSLYSAVGAPVFLNEKYMGAIIINIDLSKLHQKVLLNVDENDTYVLINEKGQVLLNHSHQTPALKKLLLWQDILPQPLADLSLENIKHLPSTSHFNSLLVQKTELALNGWTLLKYQSYASFSNPIFERFMGLFFLLFFGQIVLLGVIYIVTSRTFIKPTQQFISHIAYSAQGDHGKIQPPSGWLHWFNLVGDIFSQNRSLMQQLKEQNNILDSKVFALNADFFSYTISKYGLFGATEMMAQALSPKVRVNGIAPGLTLISETQSESNFDLASHMNFNGAPLEVDDIARSVSHLINTKSINGAVLPVDGGQKMMNFTKDVVDVATGILEKNRQL